MSKIDINDKEVLEQIYQWAIERADLNNETLVSIELTFQHCCLSCLSYGHEVIKMTTEDSGGFKNKHLCCICGVVHQKKRMKRG